MLKKMISCIVAFSVLSTMFHLNKTHAADIDNGNKITQLKELHKVVINEQLSIDIYVPQGDRTSGKQYPTMYVMDGKYYFYNAIAFQKSLRHNVNKSPEFIVVGININDLPDNPNLRRELLGDSADKMISLLENQVFPYVDKHFPSNHTRMYFGWQFAAGFGLELFSKRPNLIEGYFLASSPMFSDKRIPRLADTLQKHKGLNNYFYLTLGETELHATSKHHTLSKLLKQHEQNGIKSHYNLSDNHNHQTTPLDSFTSGLEWYFSDFPDMTFYSVDDVGKFGGASAVKEYYNNRGSRYNISPKVGKQARFSMFRHAAKEDDWETFQSFERELGEYELTDKSSEYWFKFFGQFYQKNTPFRAEKLYKQAVEVHPTSHHLWAGFAEANEQLGKVKLALNGFQKAMENSTAQEPEYSIYQQKIEILRNP